MEKEEKRRERDLSDMPTRQWLVFFFFWRHFLGAYPLHRLGFVTHHDHDHHRRQHHGTLPQGASLDLHTQYPPGALSTGLMAFILALWRGGQDRSNGFLFFLFPPSLASLLRS